MKGQYAMNRQMKSPDTGRSMIEMLGTIAIIAVLTIGGLKGYSMAMRRHRLNETISQIALISTNIRTFYAEQDTYGSLNLSTAIKYNIVTQKMVGTNSFLVNPYKGRIVFSLDKSVRDGPDQTAFVITYRDLPAEACVGLARTDWGHGEKYGFISLSVGHDDQDPDYPAPPSEYFVDNRQIHPITVVDALQHCTGSSQNAQSTVSIKFY